MRLHFVSQFRLKGLRVHLLKAAFPFTTGVHLLLMMNSFLFYFAARLPSQHNHPIC